MLLTPLLPFACRAHICQNNLLTHTELLQVDSKAVADLAQIVTCYEASLLALSPDPLARRADDSAMEVSRLLSWVKWVPHLLIAVQSYCHAAVTNKASLYMCVQRSLAA